MLRSIASAVARLVTMARTVRRPPQLRKPHCSIAKVWFAVALVT
jgi:hypothetical protein